MKIIKTYESFNLDELDLGEFSDRIEIKFLIPNEDGTYDYKGHLDFSEMGLNSLLEIPIRFRRVSGSFWCNGNQLISLKGSPSYVGEKFDCAYNKIISLQYAPSEIGGHFFCHNNNLLSNAHSSTIGGGLFFTYRRDSKKNLKEKFIITDKAIETIKLMTYEQQMAELDFFGKYDQDAYRMLLKILNDLGVDVKERKGILDYVDGLTNAKEMF